MEHNYNDIDELFQSSFENFEVEPPAELKAAIDKQLKFKTKRRFGNIWYFGVFAIALIISAITFFKLNKTETHLSKNEKQSNHTIENKNNFKNRSNHLNSYEVKKSNSKQKSTKNRYQQEDAVKDNNSNSRGNYQLASNKKINSSVSSTFAQKTNLNKQKSKNKIAKNRKSKSKSALFNSTSNNQDLTKNDKEPLTRVEKDNSLIQSNTNTNSQTDVASSTTSSAINSGEQPKDSSATDSALNTAPIKADSSINNTDPAKPQKNKRNIPLLLSLKTDYTIPFNRNSNEESFTSNNAFHFQLEASYLIRPKFGATSGINYFSSSQTFSKTTLQLDSLFTGITYDPIFADSLVYIYDSNQMIIDSSYVSYIIDSTAHENYEIINSSTNNRNSFSVSSFSIPLLFYYNQKLSDKIYLDLNAGAILNFQKIRFTDSANPLNSDLTLSKFGVKAILKTSLRYQFSHLGVSLNNNFLYDFAPIQTLNSKRKVMSWGVGVGVSWRF
ncbi:MAG: hypothetical protein ACK5B9_07685 [Flavobacteriia bacterium]